MFKARSSKRGREAIIPLCALLLMAMIASSSPALAQVSVGDGSILEKTMQELLAYRRSARRESRWQAHQSLFARQPAPDCALTGPEPETVDADQWALLKLNYERHCYKQAEILIRKRLRLLAFTRPSPRVEATGNSSRHQRLGTLKMLARAIVNGATGNSNTRNGNVAVEDAAPAAAGAVPPTITDIVTETMPSDTLASSAPLKDAEFYRDQGKAFYLNGDLAMALVDFDLAIKRNPNFEDAYIERGITLYRMRAFNRAFEDMAEAMRIKNAQQTLTRLAPQSVDPMK